MIDSIIDFISELLGKATENTPDIDAGNLESTPFDSDDVVNTDSDYSDENNVDGTDAIGIVEKAGSDVISGNSEVDNLIVNGIDTSSMNDSEVVSNDNHNPSEEKSPIHFVGAAKCNLCSCQQYVGGDGVNDLCICGHKKCQHVWI